MTAIPQPGHQVVLHRDGMQIAVVVLAAHHGGAIDVAIPGPPHEIVHDVTQDRWSWEPRP